MKLPLAATMLVACIVAMVASIAQAQQAAQRPLRILVGAAPSSLADEQLRVLSPALERALQRRIIVDNRAGAHGIVATEIGAKSNPDGGTLLLGNSITHAINATLYTRLPYDPIRDFTPITQISASGMIVVGQPKLPGNTLSELATYAQPSAGKLRVSVTDTVEQFAGDALWAHLGWKATNVQHKSSITAMEALRAGQVDLTLLTPAAARPHVHAGRLKAYATTGADRSPILPEVPTLQEQDVTGYEFPLWEGLFAPTHTPKEIIDAIHRGVAQALDDNGIRQRFDDLGVSAVGSTPQAFAAKVKRDLETFRKHGARVGIQRM